MLLILRFLTLPLQGAGYTLSKNGRAKDWRRRSSLSFHKIIVWEQHRETQWMHLSVERAQRAPLFHVAPIRIQLSFSLWLALISLCVLRKINSMASPVAHTEGNTISSERVFTPTRKITQSPLSLSRSIHTKLMAKNRRRAALLLSWWMRRCARMAQRRNNTYFEKSSSKRCGPLLRTGSLKDWRVILIPFWIAQATAMPTEKALCARRHQHQQQRQSAQSRAEQRIIKELFSLSAVYWNCDCNLFKIKEQGAALPGLMMKSEPWQSERGALRGCKLSLCRAMSI